MRAEPDRADLIRTEIEAMIDVAKWRKCEGAEHIYRRYAQRLACAVKLLRDLLTQEHRRLAARFT